MRRGSGKYVVALRVRKGPRGRENLGDLAEKHASVDSEDDASDVAGFI